jgi:hypothetical protein
MVRKKTLIAISLIAAAFFGTSAASAKKPRDDFFNPQKKGTRLKLFGFFGPGFRATLENRAPLEEDMSELHTQVIGDVNPGFSEGSLNMDVRVFLLSFGASVGIRNDWHILKFEPAGPEAGAEEGLDHGESELNRKARWLKDADYDWREKTWPWYEGRFRVLAPMYNFMGVTTLHVRYQDRGFDNAFDWPTSTVFDRGLFAMWETFLVARNKHLGFIGPASRVLFVPRGRDRGNKEYELDWHYGVLAGTQVGPGNRDLVLLRFYTTLGLDDDFMGTQAFRAPIQIVFGYQADLAF